MPIPTWSVGQVLASADVNSWFVPLAAVRTAGQSVTSSTTLVNDNTLFLPLAASSTYIWLAFLDYEAANGGDIKYQWTVPTGGVLRGGSSYMALTGVAVSWQEFNAAAVSSARGNGAGNGQSAVAYGSVTTGVTAGNLQTQWAQNTSSATATIMHLGSFIIAWHVA